MKARFVNEYVVLQPKSKEDIIMDLKKLTQKELDTLLIRTTANGIKELVEMCLNAGADINTKIRWGRTPLMVASLNGYKDIVKMFVDIGVNVNAKSKDGQTALIIASQNGYTDIVKLLKKYGAKE